MKFILLLLDSQALAWFFSEKLFLRHISKYGTEKSALVIDIGHAGIFLT
jgi:hypothetical protein